MNINDIFFNITNTCNSIGFLRKFYKTYSESFYSNNVPLISTVYAASGTLTDYSYNDVLRNLHRRDAKLNAGVGSLIPASELKLYFLSTSNWKQVEKLPTILRKFERYVICQHLIVDNKISTTNWTKKCFNRFVQATTHPDLNDGNDYENLETLGKETSFTIFRRLCVEISCCLLLLLRI